MLRSGENDGQSMVIGNRAWDTPFLADGWSLSYKRRQWLISQFEKSLNWAFVLVYSLSWKVVNSQVLRN
jgi:hypothetical protein